jgi:hypothetical protein
MDNFELTLKHWQKYLLHALLNKNQVKVLQQKSILMFPAKLKVYRSGLENQNILKIEGRNGITILENNICHKILFFHFFCSSLISSLVQLPRLSQYMVRGSVN